MNFPDYPEALCSLDRCISSYSQDCRTRVSTFVSAHFSLRETFELHRRAAWRDLLCNPLNALWSIPYLTLKKIAETTDKVGWSGLNSFIERLPSGIRTSYQKEVGCLIRDELLKSPGDERGYALIEEFKKDPVLSRMLSAADFREMEEIVFAEINKGTEKFTGTQAALMDLAGAGLTFLAGKMILGNGTMSVLGLGKGYAKKVAHDKAASGFFLGHKAGSVFYNMFPVEPSRTQVYLATFGMGVLLTLCSLCVVAVSDPIRKALGLHENRLHNMVDELEERLFLNLKKHLQSQSRDKSGELEKTA